MILIVMIWLKNNEIEIIIEEKKIRYSRFLAIHWEAN